MTDATLTIILGALPQIILACATLIAVVIGLFQNKKIHTLVNSKSLASDALVAALQAQVAQLIAQKAEQTQAAALLAQTAAHRDRL